MPYILYIIIIKISQDAPTSQRSGDEKYLSPNQKGKKIRLTRDPNTHTHTNLAKRCSQITDLSQKPK